MGIHFNTNNNPNLRRSSTPKMETYVKPPVNVPVGKTTTNPTDKLPQRSGAQSDAYNSVREHFEMHKGNSYDTFEKIENISQEIEQTENPILTEDIDPPNTDQPKQPPPAQPQTTHKGAPPKNRTNPPTSGAPKHKNASSGGTPDLGDVGVITRSIGKAIPKTVPISQATEVSIPDQLGLAQSVGEDLCKDSKVGKALEVTGKGMAALDVGLELYEANNIYNTQGTRAAVQYIAPKLAEDGAELASKSGGHGILLGMTVYSSTKSLTDNGFEIYDIINNNTMSDAEKAEGIATNLNDIQPDSIDNLVDYALDKSKSYQDFTVVENGVMYAIDVAGGENVTKHAKSVKTHYMHALGNTLKAANNLIYNREEKAEEYWNIAKEEFSNAWNEAKETFSAVGDMISDGFNSCKDFLLGTKSEENIQKATPQQSKSRTPETKTTEKPQPKKQNTVTHKARQAAHRVKQTPVYRNCVSKPLKTINKTQAAKTAKNVVKNVPVVGNALYKGARWLYHRLT